MNKLLKYSMIGVICFSIFMAVSICPVNAKMKISDQNVSIQKEYVKTDDGLILIEQTGNITLITNLDTGDIASVKRINEYESELVYPNGEMHKTRLIGEDLYLDDDIIGKVETTYEQNVASAKGINGPWIYAYSRKVASDYDKQGRDITTAIIGFIPYIGVVSNAISLIKAVVNGKPQARVYMKIDTYHDNSYRYLKDQIFVYENANYTGSQGSIWTGVRQSV